MAAVIWTRPLVRLATRRIRRRGTGVTIFPSIMTAFPGCTSGPPRRRSATIATPSCDRRSVERRGGQSCLAPTRIASIGSDPNSADHYFRVRAVWDGRFPTEEGSFKDAPDGGVEVVAPSIGGDHRSPNPRCWVRHPPTRATMWASPSHNAMKNGMRITAASASVWMVPPHQEPRHRLGTGHP